MNEIIIRKAILEDLFDIQSLNNKLFDLEYKNFDDTLKVGWPFEKEGEEYFKNAIQNDIVYVAIKEDLIVGYLAGSICDKNSYVTVNFVELDNMFVLEDYRKYGIGTMLFETFKDYCINNGINNIKVTASSKNLKAIQFYLKNGFEEYNSTFRCEIK
jgi:diamine N-acetyltransferase